MFKLLSFTLLVLLSESLFAGVQNSTVKSLQTEFRQNFFGRTAAYALTGRQGDAVMVWFGTVDDDVHLIIQGSKVQIKTNSGNENLDQIYGFGSPLPRQEVKVSVKKKEGRGTATVVQMPTSSNDYTAIVQIIDKGSGAREYELEISWNR